MHLRNMSILWTHKAHFRVYKEIPLPVPIKPDPPSAFTMKRHWPHSCTTSIQIQLPCLQRNATGTLPVPDQSRPSFRVCNETPLVPFLYHINPDPSSLFTKRRHWSLSYTTQNKPAFSILISSDIFEY